MDATTKEPQVGMQESIQTILPQTLNEVKTCHDLITRLHRTLILSDPGPEKVEDATKEPSTSSMSVKEQLIYLRNTAGSLNSRLSNLANDVGEL